ncbi:MAG: glycosyltransferase family 4 protein [Candidatus Marinimicrobia bacterium]|nr:glycosyltransferase family 4 protein [Candidatus Neomarinimicrobiota bacterium]MCF7828800.1 glycosyltransferase family 4 protein [Candidatus Neomarinimicrobiota bacterium]MCF7880717.1 glycosyltransferase family 4 protein [Candidatus Neomarinimicrobiota bacterium]
MKIGLIIYGDLETLTGGYLYDRKVVEHLREAGHEVSVISLNRQGYLRNVPENLSTKIMDEIETHQPDLLLIDELVHPSLFLRMRNIKTHFSVPVIAIVHLLAAEAKSNPVTSWFSKRAERKFLHNVDGYVAISQQTVAQVVTLLGLPKPHVVAYPAGDRFGGEMTEEGIRANPDRDGPLRILVLGNLTPRKNALAVLRACQDFTAQEVNITLVGDPEYKPDYTGKIQRFVRKNSMESIVQIAGKIESPAEIAQFFKRSDLLVLPSFAEGFPLVHVEAAGFGIPSIATAQSAANEFITHGENGYIVSPGDLTKSRGLIRELVKDRDKLATMSVNAFRAYLKHPTWEETGHKVREFLEGFAYE